MPGPGLAFRSTGGFCFFTLGSQSLWKKGNCPETPKPHGSEITWKREAMRRTTEVPDPGLTAS